MSQRGGIAYPDESDGRFLRGSVAEFPLAFVDPAPGAPPADGRGPAAKDGRKDAREKPDGKK